MILKNRIVIWMFFGALGIFIHGMIHDFEPNTYIYVFGFGGLVLMSMVLLIRDQFRYKSELKKYAENHGMRVMNTGNQDLVQDLNKILSSTCAVLGFFEPSDDFFIQEEPDGQFLQGQIAINVGSGRVQTREKNQFAPCVIVHSEKLELPYFCVKPRMDPSSLIGKMVGGIFALVNRNKTHMDVSFPDHPEFDAGFRVKAQNPIAVQKIYSPKILDLFHDANDVAVDGGGRVLMVYLYNFRSLTIQLSEIESKLDLIHSMARCLADEFKRR